MESRVTPKTGKRRPTTERPQESLPNRCRVLLFRGVPVLMPVAWGGCSTTLKDCFVNETTHLPTSGRQALISQGCMATETEANGWAVLDCEGVASASWFVQRLSRK